MSAGLALAADPGVVERAADPGAFVVSACERARAWLREALEHGEIGRIAEIKSQAEAVRVYTAQRQMGKDAQLAAAEIVRRAERGIGLAIRQGQEQGQIRRRGQGGGQPPGAARPRDDKTMSSPSEFASPGELRGNGAGIYHLADGVSDTEFEEALAAAQAEQDLSRANVVRKIRQRQDTPGGPGPGRQFDANRIAEKTVHALEGLAMGVELADVAGIDPAEAPEWAASMERSLRVLRRFARQIKQIQQIDIEEVAQ